VGVAVKPLIDFFAGRDWNVIADNVIAGLILIVIPAAIGFTVAMARGWKGPAHWFAERAVRRLPESVQETVSEELHTEIDYGSPRAAIKFAFGIWFRVRDLQAVIGTQMIAEVTGPGRSGRGYLLGSREHWLATWRALWKAILFLAIGILARELMAVFVNGFRQNSAAFWLVAGVSLGCVVVNLLWILRR
jgi:hypothetical protein